MSKTINAFCGSGGGALGSWSLGCLNWLVFSNKISFQVFSGTSVGAQLGTVLARGRGLAAQTALLKTINEAFDAIKTPDQIYRRRGLWQRLPSAGLVFDLLASVRERSIYDWSPLNAMIDRYVKPEEVKASGNELRVSVVNFNSGQLKVVDQNEPQLRAYVKASSAMPVFAPPIEIDGQLYVDGGLIDQTPLKSTFEAIETIYQEGDVVNIYVVLTTPIEPIWMANNKFNNVLDMLLRHIEVSQSNTFKEDLEVAFKKNHEAGCIDAEITVFEPRGHYFNALAFNHNAIQTMKRLGEQEAAMELP